MTSSALHFRKITWFTLKEVLKRGICGGKEHDLEVIEMTAEAVSVRDFEDLNLR